MYVQVAICLAVEHEENIHTGNDSSERKKERKKRAYVRTRTRVTSCPRPNTHRRPPFGIPSKYLPLASPPYPFALIVSHPPPQPFPRGFIDRPQSPAPAILPLHPLENPKASISLRLVFLPPVITSLASSFTVFRLASGKRDQLSLSLFFLLRERPFETFHRN